MNKSVFYILGTVLLLWSCNSDEELFDEALYLQLDDFKITQAEYDDFIAALPVGADTSYIVQKWVQTKVTDHAVLSKWKNKLDQSTIDYRVEIYRKDLSLSLAEDLMSLKAAEQVNIEDSAILNYYKQNLETFKSRGELYQLIYIKISKESPLKSKIIKLLSKPNEKNIGKLRDKYKYEVDQFLEVDQWIDVDEMMEELDLYEDVKLQKNVYTELWDNKYTYLLFVKDVYSKEYLPFELVKPRVKEILEREEKLKLVRQEKQKLYEKYVKDNQ